MAWQAGSSIPGLRPTASTGANSPAPQNVQNAPNPATNPATNNGNPTVRASIPVDPLNPACVCNPRCSCGVADKIKQQLRDDQTARFLKGLNGIYAGVRSQIMLMNPLPSMNKACSMVQAQERQMYPYTAAHEDYMESIINGTSHKTYNLGSTSENNPNNAAMIFLTRAVQSGNPNQRKNNNKRTMMCTYCRLTGHTEDKCYKKHGYPPGYKGKWRTGGSANSVQVQSGSDHPPPFTHEQYDKLMYILGQEGQNSCSTPSHSLSHFSIAGTSDANHKINLISSGPAQGLNTGKISTLNSLEKIEWIIDTGATCHIVCSTRFFSDFKQIDNMHANLPNGERINITHIGTVKFSDNLLLENVYCVPTFHLNLISVSELLRKGNYCVFLKTDYCVIQDTQSWTMIGIAKMQGGLYKLASPVFCSHLVSTVNIQL